MKPSIVTAILSAFALMLLPGIVCHAGAADSKELDGTWVITAAELAPDFPAKQLIGGKWIFANGKLKLVYTNGKVQTGTFSIDPSVKPKQLSFRIEGPEGYERKAAYQLNGDELKICHGDNKTPPKEVNVNEGLLETFKRVKE